MVSWTRHAISEITVHDLATGERTGTLALPGTGHAGGHARLGTTGGISSGPKAGTRRGSATPTTPPRPTVYHYDARRGEVSRWAQAPGAVEVPDVRTRQVTFASKDGTEVRMLVIGGGDQAADGHRRSRGRPSCTAMAASASAWRRPTRPRSWPGWRRAACTRSRRCAAAVRKARTGTGRGCVEHKQAVFDDFHAAAETLIAGGWTTPGQLGISGGSNGGLLVGAALTQRPDLYRAVVCSAPLLDMVRYERFGLGQTWNDEYGTAADPVELGWLLGYSPYHRVRPGTPYPATLFTVFDNDTRVDPRARVEDVRRAAAGDVGAVAGAPGPAPPGAGGGPRRPRGQPVGHAVRGHAGLPRRPDRPKSLSQASIPDPGRHLRAGLARLSR